MRRGVAAAVLPAALSTLLGFGWGSLGATLMSGCDKRTEDAGTSPAQMADLVFSGGPILTLDEGRPVVEELAVAEGRILALGTRSEVESVRGAGTREFDLAGRTLLPAFVDHHVHLLNTGISLLWSRQPPEHFIDLAGLSQTGIGRALRERTATLQPGHWILGKGWSQGVWGTEALPDHTLLSDAAPDHPVFFTRVDAHAGWVNSRALQLAGIDSSKGDPAGGSIQRTAAGEPSGVLLERANELVLPLLPMPSEADIEGALRAAANTLAAQGVTEVFDAGFLAVPGIVDLGLDAELYLALLMRLDEEQPLPLRVNLMVPAPSELARRVTAEPASYRELSPRLRVTHLKLFIDGALGSRGALLSHPYADDGSTRGVRRMTAADVEAEALRALDAGLDVATHAIGDQAIAEVLDVYERILGARADVVSGRLRIEHFSYARPQDFERASELGIVLSVQPNFVLPDDQGLAMEDRRVGVENSERVYAWGRLTRLGSRLVLGSDYFTTPLAPLYTFYAAVTRKNAAGLPADGWQGEERLDRMAALRLATSIVTPGSGHRERGALEAGAPADLTVLTADPLSAGEREILRIGVEATFLAGEQTHPRR